MQYKELLMVYHKKSCMTVENESTLMPPCITPLSRNKHTCQGYSCSLQRLQETKLIGRDNTGRKEL